MESKNTYKLPLNPNDINPPDPEPSPAHTGALKYSIDYECDEDTPIMAARDGIVVWLKDDSNEGGPDRKYWLSGNRVVIKHENQEYTAYEHLRYKGVMVKVGQKVKIGEVIGYSGNTGYSFGPHLHFEVFIHPDKEESEGETLEPVFE